MAPAGGWVIALGLCALWGCSVLAAGPELPVIRTISSVNGVLETSLDVVVSRLGGPIAFNRHCCELSDFIWHVRAWADLAPSTA